MNFLCWSWLRLSSGTNCVMERSKFISSSMPKVGMPFGASFVCFVYVGFALLSFIALCPSPKLHLKLALNGSKPHSAGASSPTRSMLHSTLSVSSFPVFGSSYSQWSIALSYLTLASGSVDSSVVKHWVLRMSLLLIMFPAGSGGVHCGESGMRCSPVFAQSHSPFLYPSVGSQRSPLLHWSSRSNLTSLPAARPRLKSYVHVVLPRGLLVGSKLTNLRVHFGKNAWLLIGIVSTC